jgi:hypothetical protein
MGTSKNCFFHLKKLKKSSFHFESAQKETS